MCLIPGPIKSNFQKNSDGQKNAGPPDAIKQLPETVANLALREVKNRRKPYVVVAKIRVKILFALFKRLPTKWALSIMARFH